MTRAQRLVIMAIGAAGFGGIVYGISTHMAGRRRGLAPAGPPQCDVIGPRGGSVAGFPYLERVTPGADPESALPMVVIFHSKGARPEHFAGMFYRSLGIPMRVIVPQGPLKLGNNFEWFRLPGRTEDQEELTEQMSEVGELTAKFLADIVRCRPTKGRPVVTGSSQGGSMTYLMATLYPYLVRGGVAAAGWLPAQLWSPHMAPTFAMHGTKDAAVPFASTAEYAAAMQAQGAPFTWRTYPVGHSISMDMSGDWRAAVRHMLERAP